MYNGKKVSFYVAGKDRKPYAYLQELANERNISVSSLLSDNIQDICIQKVVNVKLSVGAYLAIADGRFDLLNRIKLDNGLVMITLSEDGYKSKNGTKSEYARKIDDWNSKFQ